MKINGMDFFLEEGVRSIQEFLLEQGYNPDHVAIEVNAEVVPKNAYDEWLLTNDDVIEIVRFVGGG